MKFRHRFCPAAIVSLILAPGLLGRAVGADSMSWNTEIAVPASQHAVQGGLKVRPGHLLPGAVDSDPRGDVEGRLRRPADFARKANAGGNGTDHGDAPASYGDAAHDIPGVSYLETVTMANVDETWQTVALRNAYANPVVVCTYNLPSTADAPAVVRIRNAGATSFELRVQNPGDLAAVTPSSVSCLVAEEGLHTLPDGRAFEAHRVTSNSVDHANYNWQGQTATVTGSYTHPVVLGQVMTFNDSRWSVFWDYDCHNRIAPPASGTGRICIGKHVGEDAATARSAEDLGYFIVEAGTGSFNGISYEAALGGKSIRGVGNATPSPPYSYGLSGTFDFAVASQAGMDGYNGGWVNLYGSNSVGASLKLVEDEDQIHDSERWHLPERVGYWAFTVTPKPYLGHLRGDPETASQSSNDARGDDSDASVSDEDGVTFYTTSLGTDAEVFADVAVVNDSGGDVHVCAWMDRWTNDGSGTAALDGSFDTTDIADVPAQACQTVADNNGVATTASFHWTGLPRLDGHSYARFRVCTTLSDCNSPTGAAQDGEVEDYRIDFRFSPTSAVVDGFRVRWRRVGDLVREVPGLAGALSGLDADAGVAVVRWETLQEQGTLGFRVERRRDSAEWLPVHARSFLPGLITAPQGGEYLLLDDGVRACERWTYRLTEKEVRGSERHYGPWEVMIGNPDADCDHKWP